VVSEDEMAVARRAIDLFIAGDRDAAWALWAEDCVGIPPRDWPEPGPFRGREENRAAFDGWNVVFGREWTSHLAVREMTNLGEGRVLNQLEFKASGVESGLPVDQQLAVILTVTGGEIVKAEFFMEWREARSSAGLE
jgi:ketosteroid isomerase-like protein